MKNFEPGDFGLKNTVVLETESSRTIAIIIDRKSRIVMKDGQRILEQARKIMKKVAGISVKVRTTAPVCSKTRALLAREGIMVEKIDLPG